MFNCQPLRRSAHPAAPCRAAMAAAALLLSSVAGAQIDRTGAFALIPAATVEHPLLVLPNGAQATGTAAADGWYLSAAVEDGFRVYRATRGERTQSLRVALSAPPRHVAFNPATGRFATLALTVRVELRDDGDLDRVVEAAGGTGAKAYPMLGFALVHLPAGADPVAAAQAAQAVPGVISAGSTSGGRGVNRAERTRPMSAAARLAFAGLLALWLAACGGGGGGGGGGPTSPPPTVTDSMPSFGSATIADKTYTRDEAIEPETLPAATGGDGALTYSLSPDLPAGLAFDASTRVLSGTPTAAQTATAYTYRVTDSDSTNPDSATLTFSIAVNEPPPGAGIAIAANATSVNEWEDATGVDITVTLGAVASEATAVELRASGTATLGADFDLIAEADGGATAGTGGGDTGADTVALVVPAGGTTATARLTPIRDLDEEGDETATVAVAAVAGERPQSGTPSVDIAIIDTGRPMPGEGTAEDFALLFGYLAMSTTADAVEISALLFNDGTVASSATTGYLQAGTSPEHSTGTVRATPDPVSIGALEPYGDPWEGTFSIPLSSLSASQNYYLEFVVARVGEEPLAEELDETRAFGDFHVDADGRVRATCSDLGGITAPVVATDPLFEDQWHLRNTGQPSYAVAGGVEGEDFRMAGVLENGPTGPASPWPSSTPALKSATRIWRPTWNPACPTTSLPGSGTEPGTTIRSCRACWKATTAPASRASSPWPPATASAGGVWRLRRVCAASTCLRSAPTRTWAGNTIRTRGNSMRWA